MDNNFERIRKLFIYDKSMSLGFYLHNGVCNFILGGNKEQFLLRVYPIAPYEQEEIVPEQEEVIPAVVPVQKEKNTFFKKAANIAISVISKPTPTPTPRPNITQFRSPMMKEMEKMLQYDNANFYSVNNAPINKIIYNYDFAKFSEEYHHIKRYNYINRNYSKQYGTSDNLVNKLSGNLIDARVLKDFRLDEMSLIHFLLDINNKHGNNVFKNVVDLAVKNKYELGVQIIEFPSSGYMLRKNAINNYKNDIDNLMNHYFYGLLEILKNTDHVFYRISDYDVFMKKVDDADKLFAPNTGNHYIPLFVDFNGSYFMNDTTKDEFTQLINKKKYLEAINLVYGGQSFGNSSNEEIDEIFKRSNVVFPEIQPPRIPASTTPSINANGNPFQAEIIGNKMFLQARERNNNTEEKFDKKPQSKSTPIPYHPTNPPPPSTPKPKRNGGRSQKGSMTRRSRHRRRRTNKKSPSSYRKKNRSRSGPKK